MTRRPSLASPSAGLASGGRGEVVEGRRAVARSAPAARPRLLASYDAVVSALLEEIDRSGPGDRIDLRLYLFEPGRSSGAVLEALRRAAWRGAEVRATVDATAASTFSRVWERTRSCLPELRALAREVPDRVVVTAGKRPDHSKVARFHRAEPGASAALFGGCNLGDRFRSWRDFAVRVGRPDVAALDAKLGGAPGPGYPPPPGGLSFVANAPAAPGGGLFEVRPVLEALTGDPAVVRLRVAAAYLDTRGAAVLARALARGAAVELLLPRRANVYAEANMRALARLVRAGGRLRARLHPAMIHAKALLAERSSAGSVAFLGSANLKRNSFEVFGELSALVADPGVTDDLAAELDRLWEEAEPVTRPPRYARLRAVVEERLG